MPRSVYWPLRHMSHSPTAQAGHGTGSGRRTMPTIRSPFARPLPPPRPPPPPARPPSAPPERLGAEPQALLSGWGVAVFARDDFTIGATDAERDGAHQHRPVGER